MCDNPIIMSYPKPLSRETLERRYSETGLSKEQLSFLELFFSSCANLYGAIHIIEAWDVYKRIKDEKPRLHRKDLLNYGAVAQRDQLPFYVLEESELYLDGEKGINRSHIVNRQLVGKGTSRYDMVYNLLDVQRSWPYNVPEDFIGNAISVPSAEEIRLLDFLGSLKVTEDEIESWGIKRKVENKGKRLGEIRTLSRIEQSIIDYEKRPSFKEYYINLFSGTVSERLFREFKLDLNIGFTPFSKIIEHLFDQIYEYGVSVSDKDFEALSGMLMEFNNKTRLWFNCGWAPWECSRYLHENGLVSEGLRRISMGPGMKAHFKEHPEEYEEFLKATKAMGIEIVDE